ncbi:DUF6875 domain-containing protein [Streptomyces olivoreticuli]|uniref:DUF6875 domain-containing protein n=1 Tax=Streptomyces olivoreticuli TaxID=68246 RepID=UPI000E280805|nr:hypothetical protein [Streptomyces olivoreticuli]
MSHGYAFDDSSNSGRARPSRLRLYDQLEAAAHDLLLPVADWVSTHVARPHPDLGRRGAVCPFVPLSQRLGLLRFALADPPVSDEPDLLTAATALKTHWQAMEPHSGPHTIDKTIVLVLPGVDATTVVRAHDRLKPEFVANGMMLGEFFPDHPGPGLHNPAFRPLHSDTPLLVVRSMVANDLPFLTEKRYPPERRAGFVAAFLEHQGSASATTRERAREELELARGEVGRCPFLQ